MYLSAACHCPFPCYLPPALDSGHSTGVCPCLQPYPRTYSFLMWPALSAMSGSPLFCLSTCLLLCALAGHSMMWDCCLSFSWPQRCLHHLNFPLDQEGLQSRSSLSPFKLQFTSPPKIKKNKLPFPCRVNKIGHELAIVQAG